MSPQRMVDWPAAGRWAGRLVPAGPTTSRSEAADLVAALRRAARRSRALALEASGLAAALERPGAVTEPAQVLVVDRAGWSAAAAGSFAGMLGPRSVPGAAMQAGSVLALLASRVLGQFDPYGQLDKPGQLGQPGQLDKPGQFNQPGQLDQPGQAPRGGRLLVVAPNVLAAERAMGVVGRDFRLWVCAHEQTHALQFAAAPWLAGYLRTEVEHLLSEVTATPGGTEVAAFLAGVRRAVRPGATWSVLDVLPAGQLEIVARVTAVMSLLEGHADVTMDAVRGIPSAPTLRARMERRRSSAKPVDVALRRLLGLDVKLAQYRDGARFVRAVRAKGGQDALDAVWEAPDALPRPGEIADAGAWLRRVHGTGAR